MSLVQLGRIVFFLQLLCDYFQIYFSAKHSSNSCCPTRKLSWVQAGIREAEVKWDLISDQSHKWPLSGNQWHPLAAFFFQKTHVSVVSDSKCENILGFIWQFSLPWLPGYLKLLHKCSIIYFSWTRSRFHFYLCKCKSTSLQCQSLLSLRRGTLGQCKSISRQVIMNRSETINTSRQVLVECYMVK